jgi:ankyrin repeat protein
MAPVPYIDFLLHPDYDGQACLVDLLEKGLGGLVTDFNKSTPLHYAALNGQLKFMKSLSEYGSTMVSCNSLNQVPLIEIIKSKHKHTLE